MRFRVPDPRTPLPNLLRRAGYIPWTEGAGESSFIRRPGAGPYPRFHLYARSDGATVELNLHLDQKRPSYQGAHAHSGEYDGPPVEGEAARIQGLIGA